MSTTLEDVIDFMNSASDSDLHTIADELQENGYEFECYECETHVCEEFEDVYEEDLQKERNDFIRFLIDRANQFGLDDMLEELKREGDRIGAYSKLGAKV